MEKLAIFIGRLQPLTLAHEEVIRRATDVAENVAVLTGSAFRPPSQKNPLDEMTREDMVNAFVESKIPTKRDNVRCFPVNDFKYNDRRWEIEVRDRVKMAMEWFSVSDMKDVVLIGHAKDDSSYYLKLFPEMRGINVENFHGINATDVRKLWFENLLYDRCHDLSNYISETTGHIMSRWVQENGQQFLEDLRENTNYKKAWDGSPFPPKFVTVDSVVTQSGYVLLIERKFAPGRGLLALPGGFLEDKEWPLDGAIRELIEETRLKMPERTLRRIAKNERVFAAPDRSDRGRVITIAYQFDLGNDIALPKVKPRSDAKRAFWHPIEDLRSENMFDDHWDILTEYLHLNP